MYYLWRLVCVWSCCGRPFVKTHLYWTYCMCQRRKGLKLHHLESCALQIPEQEVHSSLTSLGKRRKKTVQWWCALLTHNPRCVTPTHNIPLEYFTMLQKHSSVKKKKKKKIRAAYQLVPQKLGLIRQTKHKIQGCSEVKKWHWINIFFLKKKKGNLHANDAAGICSNCHLCSSSKTIQWQHL